MLCWSILSVLVGACVAASLITLCLSHLAAVHHFKQSAPMPMPTPAPGISILKPVEGAGEETYQAFSSFCKLVYPGRLELLIGTIRRNDDITLIVDRLRKDNPDRDIRLVFAELQGVNRKTSIMEALWREARGEYLFFSDADVVVDENYLQYLVPMLAQPGVGCLTCLPRGIRARTLGARLIALHYDFNYLLQWMLAKRTGGIKWAIGHTMAVPRDVLARLGGFKAWLNHLADDYELGYRVVQLGLKVVVPPYLIDCFMPQENLRAAMMRLQRWKRTMRRAYGAPFFGSCLSYPVFWALLLVLMQPMGWYSWSIFATVLATRGLLASRLQSYVGLPDWNRARWLLPLVDIIEGFTFLGAYTGTTICWADRRYRLLPDGTLTALAKNPGKH